MDALAFRDFKVEDFSSMLRWAMREEAAQAAAQARRSRRNWSRKKARLRCALWVGGAGGAGPPLAPQLELQEGRAEVHAAVVGGWHFTAVVVGT